MYPPSTHYLRGKRKIIFFSIALIFNNLMAFAQPANDLCTNAISLTSKPSCITTSGVLTGASYTAATGVLSTGSRPDVWYTFTAQSLKPVITINGTVDRISLQLLSGNCSGFTAITNKTTTAMTVTQPASSNLIIGNIYYIRVYSNNGSIGNFDICVTDPAPANNNCSGAISFLASPICTNLTGNFYASTLTVAPPTINNDCAAGATYDVWYKIVPPTSSLTVSLSGLGADITGAGIEILTGNCTSMYALACGSTTATATSLFQGTTYYVRVYGTGTAPASYANGGFSLCATYPPVTNPPSNDECSGAVNVVVKTGCTTIIGTMNGATLSSGIPSTCGSGNYDVWYMITAVSDDITTVSTSSFGSQFGAVGMELYSGTCGSLTSIACGTSSVSATLVRDQIYYVRVFSTTGSSPTGYGDFKICANTSSAPPRISSSYVNLSKNLTGGVVEPGDTLEIRMSVSLTTGNIYNTRYLANLPTHTTMLSGANDSIRVITNEGLTYRNYTATNGVNDDPGTYISSPGAGEYNIRLNLGQDTVMPSAPAFNTLTDVTGSGGLKKADRPQGGGGLLFSTSFRVVASGVIGDVIVTDPGNFVYKKTYGGADTVMSGKSFQILISEPLTICDNNFGVNNASEFGGTFGSGTSLNRSTDLSQTITGYSLVDQSGAQAIGDGTYGIVKNTSPISSTNANSSKRPNCGSPDPYDFCNNRMFNGFWNIMGDHTGTATAAGNAPPGENSLGGYMLVVNADYATTEAYRQTLTGLCPNTWYEFSAWVQNICTVCGVDSIGQQFTGTATAPSAGYPGVYPNLSFQLDGIDRYSTGQIDTVGWTKRGFMFLTGAAQTTATVSIRNNAQGGGGNDWAMDDISVSTCFPAMSYSPTNTPQVCENNSIQIGDTIRSQFNNYNYYVWQKSVDNGGTWTDVTTVQTATPVFNGTQYEYITAYDVPTSASLPADSGTIYRVYTATTLSNISNASCIANDGSAPITLSVIDCSPALGVELLNFTGKAADDFAHLQWVSVGEEGNALYYIEKSLNGNSFHTIGKIDGRNSGLEARQQYGFTDPERLKGSAWYRLAMPDDRGKMHYSATILLTAGANASLSGLVNPFRDAVQFVLNLPASAVVEVEVRNMYGVLISRQQIQGSRGANTIKIDQADQLPAGNYVLRVNTANFNVSRKIVKW